MPTVKEAIKSLEQMGYQIWPSTGFENKTWWMQDNHLCHGFSNLKKLAEGFYLDDDEILRLAEKANSQNGTSRGVWF